MSENGIGNSAGNDLISLLKNRGVQEVALPSSLNTIMQTKERWFAPKKLPTYEIIINPPEEMFGRDSFTSCKGYCIRYNVSYKLNADR